MKNGRLLAFVIAIELLAVIGIVLLWPFHVPDYLLGLSLLASLAAITGAGPIRIPSLKTSVSVTDVFVCSALGAFGAMPACLVAAAGVLGSSVGKQRHRNPVHIAFNIGNVIFSTAVAATAYLLVGGVAGAPIGSQILPLVSATTIYFLLNTGLVATAVTLDTKRSFMATWRESVLWTAASAYAGLTMAAFLLWVIQIVGPSGLALGVPPAWFLALFYRALKDRQVVAQQRVGQVEEVNAILEDKVAERTRELQQALTDIEEANIKLRLANESLTEANLAKSNFLANVSHELRTPLNAIIGFSDLLNDAEVGRLNDRQSEFVGDIHDSGDHLLKLINEILDLSKIEAGRMELHSEVVDVGKLIQEALSMLRPQAAAKQLSLSCEAAPGLAAEIDPGMFRQVLVNLLSNAVKFTPDGGSVDLRARQEGDDLLLEVEDSGIGMTPEEKERIFDEFYQVDGSYSRNYEGTGLGLALVRRMLDLHEGTISVESIKDRGSTFTCRYVGRIRENLPEPVESPAPALRPRPAEHSERTILVVEDNPMNRKLARNALRLRGYNVLEAETGVKALELLQRESVDLILMDLQLPDMDGLEVTRQLKANSRTAHVPVIALTAHAREVDEQNALEVGCVGYITKPIRLATFAEQVAAHALSQAASA